MSLGKIKHLYLYINVYIATSDILELMIMMVIVVIDTEPLREFSQFV